MVLAGRAWAGVEVAAGFGGAVGGFDTSGSRRRGSGCVVGDLTIGFGV